MREQLTQQQQIIFSLSALSQEVHSGIFEM